MNSCELKPKYELKEGTLILDIINNWNRMGKSIREEQKLNSFKKKLMEKFNKIIICDKINCHSCKN